MQLTEELTAQLVRGDIQNAHQQKRYIRKDGSTIWASLTMSMLRGDGDEPRLFFAVFEDISERKRIEAQIHGQSSVLRALTLGTPLPELLEQIALLADELWPDRTCRNGPPTPPSQYPLRTAWQARRPLPHAAKW
jgi:hypothetical protein